jgi:hypothetical protein
MRTVKVIHRRRGSRRDTEVRVGVDGPVLIHETSYHLISIEPLVGVLEFQVGDGGFVALSMNRSVALQVREMVDMFLSEKAD